MSPKSVFAGDAAILLAGGSSRRMGREKALLEIEGSTLVEHTLGILRHRFSELAVSVAASGPSTELKSALERFERESGTAVRLVPDRREGLGPLAGLEAALSELNVDRLLVLAVDTPYVFPPLIELLWREASAAPHQAAVPVFEGRAQPLYAVYTAEVLPKVRKLFQVGELRLSSLAEHEAVRRLDLSSSDVLAELFARSVAVDERIEFLRQLFQSLNTARDYERWKSRYTSFSVPQPNTEKGR